MRIALLPGALDTVRRFKAAGCALALVTNGSRRTQRMKIERFGLEPIFDAIFVEGELGFGKPDPRVYELALSRLGYSPAETWMVGDHLEWDVAAPQQLGIYGVWVDAQSKGVPRDSPVRPDLTVRSIAELQPAGMPWLMLRDDSSSRLGSARFFSTTTKASGTRRSSSFSPRLSTALKVDTPVRSSMGFPCTVVVMPLLRSLRIAPAFAPSTT